MRLFCCLEALTCLQIDFYFKDNVQGIENFLKYLLLPKNLTSLDLSFSQFQPPVVAENLSKTEYNSQELKTLVQRFVNQFDELNIIEELRLVFHFNYQKYNASLLYPLFISTLKNMPSLKILNLIFYPNKTEGRDDNSTIHLKEAQPFDFVKFCKECHSTIKNLKEINFQFPSISFEGLDTKSIGDLNQLETIYFAGDLLSEIDLTRFFRLLKPEGFDKSMLTIKTYHINTVNFISLLESIQTSIYIKKIMLKINSEKLQKNIVLETLTNLLQKLEGPTHLCIEVSGLFIHYEDHYLILDALEDSIRSIEEFKLYFGRNDDDRESHLNFELIRNNYILTDYEFVSEIGSQSSVSSFEQYEDDDFEADEDL